MHRSKPVNGSPFRLPVVAAHCAAVALFATLLMGAGRAAAQQSCESLVGVSLQDARITSATLIPAGTFTPPPPYMPIPNLPAFCRVVGVATPTSDSVINFEVWLPTEIWNGNFNGGGNGGYGGSFSSPYGWMAGGLRRGYTTAGTDMGHDAFVTPGGTWALGHPEKIVDWAYRANHLTAIAGKTILRAFYGTDPRRSYFTGCSDGGHEGLMEAQRYPSDYDGILAGASANFWTHQSAAWVWEEERQALDDPDSLIPSTKLPMIAAAAVTACDAKDGVVDGLIGEPRRCDFDPTALLCPGPDGPNCLTAPQVQGLKEIYAGPRNPRTGAQIYPGLEPGGEYGWPGDQGSLGRDFYKYMVFGNPNWDYHALDFDQDVALADSMMASVIDSTSSDLGAFRSRGGKLLMYHGWNDPRVNPRNSINYFESVVAALGGDLSGTQNFLRLFFEPGMGHCARGPGLNTFDAFTALEQWVEQGTAPERLIASNAGLSSPDNVMTPGTGSFTRPLCPYPQEARYRGTGSVDDAASFDCRQVGITPLPFIDSFGGDEIDAARWSVTATAGTAAEGGGTLTLTPDALAGDTRILVASNSSYDLTGSEASVHVNQVVSSVGVNNIFALRPDWENMLLWWYENGFLFANYYVAGVRTNVATLEYSPDVHAWWRIREYDGIVYWETSPDGASWNFQGGTATARLFSLQSLKVMLEANTFGGGSPDPGQARYSNLTFR